MAVIIRNSTLTMAEAFDSFIFSKSAQRVTDKTIDVIEATLNVSRNT